jgi:hypothetical protein
MAGYSRTPLSRKLGIKPGFNVLIIAPPRHYRALLEPLPVGVRLRRSGAGPFDMIHVFSTRVRELEPELRRLEAMMPDQGMIWVSWPKRSSGVSTDLDENTVRELALKARLVDVKVCAVDETWSGLKLVRRLKDRGARRRARHS